MKPFRSLRTLFASAFLLITALPVMSASAAIPCNELPLIEADPNMAIPMIYIELPVSVEAAFSRGQPADRADSSPLDNQGRSSVVSAAENQFRCLGYQVDWIFSGNSTPQQRVSMFAVPNIDEGTTYIALDSLYLERLGDPIQLADGRYLIDFGIIVDGDQYLLGEMVYLETEDGLYLDGTTIHDSAQLNEEPVVIELSLNTTREVKMVDVAQGDKVVFENTEDEASANITIVGPDGEIIFEGDSMGTGLVGGEDRPIFAAHNLVPGEYIATITFDKDGVTYNVTLMVSEAAPATPVATPGS